ncbi:ABC transporter ATP-binding protein [Paracoccus pacificus]|uniref:ABC transporter ATP-binding protein n=1 Tax=Paracoccus pacificus TaxID=1463598 RepID=A0ABW4R1V2_9RHOB
MQDHAARQPHLRLAGLNKSFGATEVIPGIDLDVDQGEMIALLGPSGCGKTTTLRMIAGLIAPSGGQIVVDGQDITTRPVHDRDMGMVFQSYALFPHMTVAENVAFGLEMRHMGREDIRARVAAALDMVQMGHLAERRPRELSGGQQQRVALARALVIQPSILLLDEPLSNLDAKLRDEMREQIRSLQQQIGITALFVTHDQVEALSMCDRIVVLNKGRIEQVGTPGEIYEHPATPFVADFVGRSNRLGAEVTDKRRLTVSGQDAGPTDLPPGQSDLRIRPHRTFLLPDGATPTDFVLTGTLKRTSFIGDLIEIHVDVGGQDVVIEQSTRKDHPTPPPGASVRIGWNAGDMIGFRGEDRA